MTIKTRQYKQSVIKKQDNKEDNTNNQLSMK